MANRYWTEIHEASDVLSRILTHYETNGTSLYKELAALWAHNDSPILFTGMGSSYFAGLYLATLLNEKGVPSFAWDLGELLFYHRPLLDQSRVVVISQSGETAEVLALLASLPKHYPLVALTNQLESTLSKRAQIVVPMLAGLEQSTASKTYLASLAIGFLLIEGVKRKNISLGIETMAEVICKIEGYLNSPETTRKIQELTQYALATPHLSIASRGPSLATAYEAALIIKETSHHPADGLTGPQLRHGPFEMIGSDFHGLFIVHPGPTYTSQMRLMLDIKSRGGHIAVVTSAPDEVGQAIGPDLLLPLDPVSELVAPLIDILPFSHC